MELTTETLRWAARAIGPNAKISNIHRLKGSTSSTLYAMDITEGAGALPCVLRRYDHADYLATEPDAPQHEAAALQLVAKEGVAAPALLAFDPDGAQADGTPFVLMTRMPGWVSLTPDSMENWLHGLAEALLPVHNISADGFPWQYGTYVDVPSLKPPVWSRVPNLWEQIIEIAQGPPPPAPICFIHRDYHPMNVLWEGDRVSGIVDWPSACRGVANFDVAWCRLNLLYLYGIQAADRFLAAYESLAGKALPHQAYWDSLALVETLPDLPALYPPWAEFGVHHLTTDIMLERQEAYAERILQSFAAS